MCCTLRSGVSSEKVTEWLSSLLILGQVETGSYGYLKALCILLGFEGNFDFDYSMLDVEPSKGHFE
jgi:hypothetical protein